MESLHQELHGPGVMGTDCTGKGFILDIRKKIFIEASTIHWNGLPGDVAGGFQEAIDRVLVSSVLLFPQKVGRSSFSPGQFCDSTGFYFCLKIQLIARHCFHEI